MPSVCPGTVQSYRTRGSRAGHALVVAGGWCVFVLLWWRVLERPGALVDVRGAAVLLGILAIVVGLVTWAWIAHNVALARRRGGRNSVVALHLPTVDLLGRRLDVAPEAATSTYVVVRVDGQVKQFATGARVGD
jgi:hypothetical protein